MASAIPHGRNQDTDFMFTKRAVSNLAQATDFYASVFGLVEMHRLDAEIVGRAVSEVVYMPTSEGGPMFVLAHFHDSASGASHGDHILGFATQNLDALIARAEGAGGKLLERKSAAGFEHAFIADPEGQLVQVSQQAA